MLAVKLWTEPSSHKMVPPPRNEYGEKKPQTAKGDEVRRCRARLRRGLRTSAKPTNNHLVTRGPTRLPTLPRPQRCGLTRVCSAAAEADVSVVIQVTSTTTLNDRIQRLQDCHRDLTSFFLVSVLAKSL